MINKNSINRLVKVMESFDVNREKIIKASRDVLKCSKQAIYSVHRHDISESKKLLNKAKKGITEMKKMIAKDVALNHVGMFHAALEEYTEAVCFLAYVQGKNIPTSEQVGANPVSYLGGLADLTGELGRRAVLLATSKDVKALEKIRDVVDEIFGLFLKFNIGNSDLRKKSDSIKWNLKKIEELLYETKCRK